MKKLLYALKFFLKPIEERRDYHLSKMKSIYTPYKYKNILPKSIDLDYKKPIDKQFKIIIEKLEQYSYHLSKLIDSRLLTSLEKTTEMMAYSNFINIVKTKYWRETTHWFLDPETYKSITPNIIPLEQYDTNPLSIGIIDPIKVSKIKLLRDHLFVTCENFEEIRWQISSIPNYSRSESLERELIRRDMKKRLGFWKVDKK